MTPTIPRLPAPSLEAPHWPGALALDIADFNVQSSDHRPRTRVNLSHDGEALYLQYHVDDRYVKATGTKFQDPVWQDSCVEAFLDTAPGHSKGYVNIEFGCNGVVLMQHAWGDRWKQEFTPLGPEWMDELRVFSTLTGVIDPEIEEPLSWRLAARVPLALYEHFLGPSERTWRGNFYKCASKTSHPHWASWSPQSPKLDFHSAKHFGELRVG